MALGLETSRASMARAWKPQPAAMIEISFWLSLLKSTPLTAQHWLRRRRRSLPPPMAFLSEGLYVSSHAMEMIVTCSRVSTAFVRVKVALMLKIGERHCTGRFIASDVINGVFTSFLHPTGHPAHRYRYHGFPSRRPRLLPQIANFCHSDLVKLSHESRLVHDQKWTFLAAQPVAEPHRLPYSATLDRLPGSN